jgi:hypothetical protein
MWHSIAWYKVRDIPGQSSAYIFRVEKNTLKMEAASITESSVPFFLTRHQHIPEDIYLNRNSCSPVWMGAQVSHSCKPTGPGLIEWHNKMSGFPTVSSIIVPGFLPRLVIISLLHEEFYLLGFNAAYSVESKLIFRRNILTPSSGPKNKPSKKPAWSR